MGRAGVMGEVSLCIHDFDKSIASAACAEYSLVGLCARASLSTETVDFSFNHHLHITYQ